MSALATCREDLAAMQERGTREWGFWHLGQFIHWKKYVQGFGGIADKMTACAEDSER